MANFILIIILKPANSSNILMKFLIPKDSMRPTAENIISRDWVIGWII